MYNVHALYMTLYLHVCRHACSENNSSTIKHVQYVLSCNSVQHMYMYMYITCRDNLSARHPITSTLYM